LIGARKGGTNWVKIGDSVEDETQPNDKMKPRRLEQKKDGEKDCGYARVLAAADNQRVKSSKPMDKLISYQGYFGNLVS
jgi:hypothetical protein